jgi:hypothetical protein
MGIVNPPDLEVCCLHGDPLIQREIGSHSATAEERPDKQDQAADPQ